MAKVNSPNHPHPLQPVATEVGDLRFDPENPRIAAADKGENQDQLLKNLWDQFAVDEIALSIAENGFFDYEPLFAARERGQLYVIEGNRRLAAVQLLLSQSAREMVGATDLPRASAEVVSQLQTLPVIVCERKEVWQHLGFKHINGPQQWTADSKAEYIAWVHNTLKIPLDDIARTIGDKNRTVRRLYQARMVLEQAERNRKFSRDQRSKQHFSFSHLYTGLGYAGIQEYLGIRDDTPGDLREPIRKPKLDNLGELLGWMYGDKGKSAQPLVRSQNPDLRILDEVIQSPEGVVALRRGLPLKVSLDISRGDDRLFREAIQAARTHLQRAIGTLVTGFNGEPDLVQSVEDVLKLAKKLRLDMEEHVEIPPQRRAPRKR